MFYKGSWNTRKDKKMEKDIEKIKTLITEFIEKYQIKTLKLNTNITYRSKLNTENKEKWITQNYSVVNKIDINLTK